MGKKTGVTRRQMPEERGGRPLPRIIKTTRHPNSSDWDGAFFICRMIASGQFAVADAVRSVNHAVAFLAIFLIIGV